MSDIDGSEIDIQSEMALTILKKIFYGSGAL